MPAVLDGTNGLTFNDGSIQASVAPAVRQTVLSGPVGVNGFAAFGGATGATTVTATGTLLLSAAAGGNANRAGLTTNPSWTGLSTNGTMFLFLNITAAGVATTGSTTLEPTYRWGGADVITNNQNTFNIQQMEMKVGNGATAAQIFRVFVGQVTVAGGVVTVINWYALMGRYSSGEYAVTNGTTNTLTHLIGLRPQWIAVRGYVVSSNQFREMNTVNNNTSNGFFGGDVLWQELGSVRSQIAGNLLHPVGSLNTATNSIPNNDTSGNACVFAQRNW